MSLAVRAGISLSDFWGMTACNVVTAFNAAQKDMLRLAWHTAWFHRVAPKHFPKNEDAIFGTARKPQPRRQSVREQYAMARLISRVLPAKRKN